MSDSADVIKMAELELSEVIDELFEARNKWFDIGLQLQLHHSELKSIEDKYRDDPDKCFRQMLIAWETSSSQAPKAWSTLVKILRKPAIKYEVLATRIERKYCQRVTTGEKRPHPDPGTDTESATKRHCPEDNFTCESLLHVKHQHPHELTLNKIKNRKTMQQKFNISQR